MSLPYVWVGLPVCLPACLVCLPFLSAGSPSVGFLFLSATPKRERILSNLLSWQQRGGLTFPTNELGIARIQTPKKIPDG